MSGLKWYLRGGREGERPFRFGRRASWAARKGPRRLSTAAERDMMGVALGWGGGKSEEV